MLNQIIISYITLIFGCVMPLKIDSIQTIKLYNKFITNGSTNNIRNAFDFPEKNNIDTSISSVYRIEKSRLENSLEIAKVKKHRQQKLGGLTFAGEFYVNGKKHFFAYFHSSKLVVDFTENKNYWLKDSLEYKILEQ